MPSLSGFVWSFLPIFVVVALIVIFKMKVFLAVAIVTIVLLVKRVIGKSVFVETFKMVLVVFSALIFRQVVDFWVF